MVGKNRWRQEPEGTWELVGTTTRGATLHWIDDKEKGDSFRQYNGAKPAPRLVCFKVPGGKASNGARGMGHFSYPATFAIGAIIEQEEGMILCEFVTEFPVVGMKASGK